MQEHSSHLKGEKGKFIEKPKRSGHGPRHRLRFHALVWNQFEEEAFIVTEQ